MRHLPIYRRAAREAQANATDGRLRMREWPFRHAEAINLHAQEPAMDSAFFFFFFFSSFFGLLLALSALLITALVD